MLLALNKSAITLLAGATFYPGDYVNIWFSVSLITIPLTGLFVILVLISGDMRKIAWIYLLKLGIALPGGYLSWELAGMTGITAFFTLIPLIGGFYGYWHGGRECGTRDMRRTCHVVTATALVCGVAIFICGHFAVVFAGEDLLLQILGQMVLLPSPPSLAFSLLPSVAGALLAIQAFVILYKGSAPKDRAVAV